MTKEAFDHEWLWSVLYIILITISYEQWIQSCQVSTTKNFWENVKVFWGKRTNNQEGLARDPVKFLLEHSSRAIEQAPICLQSKKKKLASCVK